jgi:hypothetical protein
MANTGMLFIAQCRILDLVTIWNADLVDSGAVADAKGQIKSVAPVDFPKTNEQRLTLSVKKQTNLVFWFFGRIYDMTICLRFFLIFILLPIRELNLLKIKNLA